MGEDIIIQGAGKSNEVSTTTIITSTTTTTYSNNVDKQDQYYKEISDIITNNNSNQLVQYIESLQIGQSLKDSNLINRLDENGKTLLYRAIELNCFADLILLLLQYGADPNKQVELKINNHSNNSNNSSSSSSSNSNEEKEEEEEIIHENTPFKLDNYKKPANRESPLHLICRKGESNLLTLLLDNHANKDQLDSIGRSPIMIASANGRMECSRLLVLSGCNVTFIDKNQKTALHLALDFDNEDIATTLTHNGGDITTRYHYKPHGRRVNTNADIEIIHTLDRYGYIHQDDHENQQQQQQPKQQQDLSTTTIDDKNQDQQLNNQNQKVSKKKIGLETIKTDKWCRMLKKWNKTNKKPSKVDRRTIKGIPDPVRGQAWKLLSESVSIASKQPADFYNNLLNTSSKSELVIDLDVNRASRNHIYFRERYGLGQISLFNVLKAYSNFDQEVGYTQGMSSIATILVMYMPENEAFWTLERLMNRPEYGMRSLFLQGLPKVHQMMFVFDNLLDKELPNLSKYFKEINLSSVIFATKWFIIGYLDTLPFHICLRIWDLIFSKGYNIVYTVAVTLLRLFEKQFIDRPFEECFLVFRQFETLKMNEDVFINHIVKNRISNRKIEALEKKYIASKAADLPINESSKKKKKSRFSLFKK